MGDIKRVKAEFDINVARQAMNTALVEELVTKFHKKYQGTTFGFIALAEAAFMRPPTPYDLDKLVPDQPFLNEKSLDFINRGISCTESSIQSLAEAHVWLAYLTLFRSGPKAAQAIVNNISQSTLVTAARSSQICSPTALLMYYSIHSWISYLLSNIPAALESIEEALTFITTRPANDYERYKNWEETIYFSASLFSKGNPARCIEITSKYLTPFVPKDPLKAVSLLKRHISLLILKLEENSVFTGIPRFESTNTHKISKAKEMYIQEIEVWLPRYEGLVTSLYHFPQGENETPIMRSRHLNVLQTFEWWVQILLFGGKLERENFSDVVERHYKTLEILYRGTTHSFHSLKLMRYLSHTFFSLVSMAPFNICIDERLEARKAVESYLFHWEKKFTLLLDVKKKAQVQTKRSSLGMKPFLSHRLSGQITQLPDYTSFSMPQGMVIEEDFVVPQRISNSFLAISSLSIMREDEKPVTIDIVDGESVPDVLGVLISGMRLILLTHEGNVEVLKEAATFGEKAFVIVTEHASNLPNYLSLLSQVYRWLGVVYGELSLEIVEKDERLSFQNEAVVMLTKAKKLDPMDAMIRYQLALQLSELGEFTTAIDEINRAILLNPNEPNFYNLVALMMSSKGQFEQGLLFTKVGFKQCQKHHEKTDVESWESIDENYRADLMNLKFTEISIQMRLLEAELMVEPLQKAFRDLKRIVGVPPTDLRRDESVDLRSKTRFKKSPSLLFSASVHRLGVYELQIALWLSVSSVYRDLGQVEKAIHAVEEAEKILFSLALIQHRARNQDSRLFNKTQQPPSGGYWNESDPSIARIQADIALEKAFIQFQKYKKQNEAKPVSKYRKYLSPIARIEAEREASLRLLHRTSSRLDSGDSSDSISISVTAVTEGQTVDSYTDGPYVGSVVRSVIPEVIADMTKLVTIDQVIQLAQFALLFDLHHLPARAFLGVAYREKGDLAQSEHHLQRACTQQRHRGSSSGRSGVPSVFGGYTSSWGWYSWNLLAISLKELDRSQDAQKAAMFAVQLESISCTRGYECIPRF